MFNKLCHTFLWTQRFTRIISDEANPLHAECQRPEQGCVFFMMFKNRFLHENSTMKNVFSAFDAPNSNKTNVYTKISVYMQPVLMPSASKSEVLSQPMAALVAAVSNFWP